MSRSETPEPTARRPRPQYLRKPAISFEDREGGQSEEPSDDPFYWSEDRAASEASKDAQAGLKDVDPLAAAEIFGDSVDISEDSDDRGIAKSEGPEKEATVLPTETGEEGSELSGASRIEKMLAGFAEQQNQFLSTLVDRLSSKGSEPSTPPQPEKEQVDFSPSGILRQMARSTAGEDAPDELIDDLASSLRDALAADRFSETPEWQDNEEAKAWQKKAQDRWRNAVHERSALAATRKELADLRRQVTEIRQAPEIAKAREEAVKRWEYAFAEPREDWTGAKADDVLARTFPLVARAARSMDLKSDLAKYAIDRYESSGAKFSGDIDDAAENTALWREVMAINKRLEPIIGTLEETSKEGRSGIAKAIKAGGADPKFSKIVDQIVKSINTANGPADSIAGIDETKPPTKQAVSTSMAPAERAAETPNFFDNKEEAFFASDDQTDEAWARFLKKRRADLSAN